MICHVDDASCDITNRTTTPLIRRMVILDFADKFYWDLGSNDVTPEQLARTTCSDLGLPGDMEPAIAHKVRETLFRLVCTWMDDPKILEVCL